MTRFAGSILLAAAIVAAVIMIPLLRPAVSPAGPTSVPATLPPNLTDSAVAAAGIIRSGGIWAIKGSLLLTPVDEGETWQATNGSSSTFSNGVVRQPSLLMLDREHAWAVSLASQVGNESGSTPTPMGRSGSSSSGRPTADGHGSRPDCRGRIRATLGSTSSMPATAS